jgi:hypothetical protein
MRSWLAPASPLGAWCRNTRECPGVRTAKAMGLLVIDMDATLVTAYSDKEE